MFFKMLERLRLYLFLSISKGRDLTSVANEFVLEMGFLIKVGKSILPEEKHRQKGDKPI